MHYLSAPVIAALRTGGMGQFRAAATRAYRRVYRLELVGGESSSSPRSGQFLFGYCAHFLEVLLAPAPRPLLEDRCGKAAPHTGVGIAFLSEFSFLSGFSYGGDDSSAPLDINSASAPQRGSMAGRSHLHFSVFRSDPHSGQSPRQSRRHRVLSGSSVSRY